MNLNLEIDYRRESGVHHFTTIDGAPVTGISANSWEEFEPLINDLPDQDGGYVLTPELITTPYRLEEIPGQYWTALSRLRPFFRYAWQNPNTTLLVGTPTKDIDGEFRNSLVVMRDGLLQGYIDKRPLWPPEFAVFPGPPRPPAPVRNKPGHAAIICSDVIVAAAAASTNGEYYRNSRLPDGTRTVFMSAAWAVEIQAEDYAGRTHEVRFSNQLERAVSGLFRQYAELDEVIMVDRSIPTTKLPPFNAHFRRTD